MREETKISTGICENSVWALKQVFKCPGGKADTESWC